MILTQNLTKRYGKTLAVNNLNLNIERGTIFGLVGENGAGKTTALSMLATLTLPTSGRAYICGHEVTREPKAVRRAIGYMPDSFGVYDDLTVMEYLRFFAQCYGVDRRTIARRAEELLDRVRLWDKRDVYVNNLSRGMQQRLEVAALPHARSRRPHPGRAIEWSRSQVAARDAFCPRGPSANWARQ